jgi:hypothetical protein
MGNHSGLKKKKVENFCISGYNYNIRQFSLKIKARRNVDDAGVVCAAHVWDFQGHCGGRGNRRPSAAYAARKPHTASARLFRYENVDFCMTFLFLCFASFVMLFE